MKLCYSTCKSCYKFKVFFVSFCSKLQDFFLISQYPGFFACQVPGLLGKVSTLKQEKLIVISRNKKKIHPGDKFPHFKNRWFRWKLNFCTEYLYCTLFNNYVILFFFVQLLYHFLLNWYLFQAVLAEDFFGFIKRKF